MNFGFGNVEVMGDSDGHSFRGVGGGEESLIDEGLEET